MIKKKSDRYTISYIQNGVRIIDRKRRYEGVRRQFESLCKRMFAGEIRDINISGSNFAQCKLLENHLHIHNTFYADINKKKFNIEWEK